MKCIKHNYRLVNNRYDKNGRIVIEGGKWITEKRCEMCDEKFPEKEINRIIKFKKIKWDNLLV